MQMAAGVHVMVISLIYPHQWLVPLVLATFALLFAGVSTRAQAPAPAPSEKGSCDASKAAEPATPVERGVASGAKNIGATGWSGGGLGGSHNETSNSGPAPNSRTTQPETASGLDPTTPQSTARADRCEEK